MKFSYFRKQPIKIFFFKKFELDIAALRMGIIFPVLRLFKIGMNQYHFFLEYDIVIAAQAMDMIFLVTTVITI